AHCGLYLRESHGETDVHADTTSPNAFMKITVVMGFFLPIPAVAGGAIEKSWHRLAQTMAKQGHEVTIVSRRWENWPRDEIRDGVRHLRLKGYDHNEKLWINLILDFLWSWRVFFRLPQADIVA